MAEMLTPIVAKCTSSSKRRRAESLIHRRTPTIGRMEVRRRVTVERNRLHFAAAHMATFAGGCEPLHGHNYQLIVELEGELDDDSWVWDFSDLKRGTKAIADELDHRFLLQRDSRVLSISESDQSWRLTFEDRSFVFPKSDVAVLPIDNTTAERLAEWVARRLWGYLEPRATAPLYALTVGVEEMPGQAGWCTLGAAAAG